MVQALDLNPSSGRAKIVAIVAVVVLAAVLLFFIGRHCYNKGILSDFRPPKPPAQKTSQSPQSNQTDFKLPNTKLKTLLDTTCAMTKKLGTATSGVTSIDPKIEDQIKNLPQQSDLSDHDYQTIETIADKLDQDLQYYRDMQKKESITDTKTIADLELFEQELEMIYAKLAEHYYQQNAFDKSALFASKMKMNKDTRSAILLAIVAHYLKEKKMAEAQWVLSEASPSEEKDQIYYEIIEEILSRGAGRWYDAYKMIQEFIWCDRSLENELRGKIAEFCFGQYNAYSTDYSAVLDILKTMSDVAKREQLLVNMGKKLHNDKKYTEARIFFANMTLNPALRDRFLRNIDKGLPI